MKRPGVNRPIDATSFILKGTFVCMVIRFTVCAAALTKRVQNDTSSVWQS